MSKESILYLAGERLVLVQGNPGAKKLTVTGYWQQELPEGTVLNGVVTDTAAFTDGLKALRAAAQKAAAKVWLVVDSSQIMAKPLTAPQKLRGKQLLNIVRSELSELDTAGRDLVYDYTELPPLPGSSDRQLLCGGAERSMVEQYIELFGAANIKLAGISSALGACLRMVEFVPELCAQSFILCVLDGQTVVTYLFAGGRYLMNTRSRLITERGGTAVLGELLGRISSMLQFSQSQKTAEPAKTVYFCGLQTAEMPGCQLVADTFNVQAMPLPAFKCVTAMRKTGFALASAFIAVGGLVHSKRRRADFLAASHSKAAPSGMEKKSAGLPWAVPILITLAVLGFWGFLLMGNFQIARQIGEVRAYTQDEANLAAVRQVHADRTAAENYAAAAAEAQRATDILNATTQPDEAMLRRADEAAGAAIGFTGYDYTANTDQLVYSCTAADYHDIPDFILRMNATGDYTAIGYGGYSQNNEGGGYVFSIACTVKGAA